MDNEIEYPMESKVEAVNLITRELAQRWLNENGRELLSDISYANIRAAVVEYIVADLRQQIHGRFTIQDSEQELDW